MRTVCCIGLCLLLSAPAAARDIFVDSRIGDNRASGQHPERSGDLSGPVRTIGKALSLAETGDALVLAPHSGPYHEGFSLVGSRYSGGAQPFTIHGNGSILDGTLPVQPEAWEPYQGTVFRFQPRLAGYQQLYLDGQPTPRVAVAAAARRPPPLQTGQWCLMGGLIYFAVNPTKLPRDYNLRAAGRETGITLLPRRSRGDLRPDRAGIPMRRHQCLQQCPRHRVDRRDLPRQRACRHQRRWRVDRRDQPIAAGRQRRGPTAHLAVQLHPRCGNAVAHQYGPRLGRSWRPDAVRRAAIGTAVEG